MPRFEIEQIALRPVDPAKAITFMKEIGLEEWAMDHVVAAGKVWDKDGKNEADLAFNYTGLNKARELEVLHYTDGPNWMDARGTSVSHLGMHVSAEQLEEWRAFFAEKGIPVAQEVFTESHTNPFLLENGRKYNYVIFDTRNIIGVDLKFIVRIDN
jgi:hypothetical protein